MNDANSDPRDYVLDLSSIKKEPASGDSAQAEKRDKSERVDETLSILFKCCNVYAKIRLTADQKAFAGHCPKCARAIRVEIDPNSPNTGRFFAVE